MSVNVLAEDVLAVADQSDKKITNLGLEKVLFFTIGMSIRRDKSELDFFNEIYDNDFEKWRYGPVVPSLYFRFNVFGDRPIDTGGNYDKDLSRFDKLIQDLLSIDVYRLVALSHKMKAWSQCERDILTGKFVQPYTLDEIARDFNNA